MRQERSAQVEPGECPWAIDYEGETVRCAERAGHDGDHLGAWRDEAVTFPQATAQPPAHNDNGYTQYGCRCADCTEAHRVRIAQYRAKVAARRPRCAGTVVYDERLRLRCERPVAHRGPHRDRGCQWTTPTPEVPDA